MSLFFHFKTTKLYFTHYSFVFIILFHTFLQMLSFSTYFLGKLVFCIFALFAMCEIRFSLHKFYSICTITASIEGVRYSVFLFSLISKKRYASWLFEYKHIWRKFLIKNKPLGSFWAIKVLKIQLIKKSVKHSQVERVKKTVNK